MIRIEVTAEVTAATAPNRPRNQLAYAYVIGRDGKPLPHPERVFLPVWRDDAPTAPGFYTLAPQSVYADKHRSLALTPKLVPIAAR
jgi:Helix-destabilising protein